MKEIYCAECNGEIKSNDDLVTSMSFIWVVPYHQSCYSKALKGCQTVFVGNEPLNGTSGTLKAIGSFFMIFFLFLSPDGFMEVGGWLLVPLLLFSRLMRLYSWFRYERHLQ